MYYRKALKLNSQVLIVTINYNKHYCVAVVRSVHFPAIQFFSLVKIEKYIVHFNFWTNFQQKIKNYKIEN